MSMLPPDETAIFLDCDAMLMGRSWFDIIERATKFHRGYSAFTCITNRIWGKYQLHQGIMSDNHDILHHWNIGEQRARQFSIQVNTLTRQKPMSGVCIIYPKKEWLKTPFRANKGSTFLGVDNNLHFDLLSKGKAVGVLLGVYAYHFYRGDGNKEHLKS